MQIPLFPLSSVVMPGGLMPLRIFERRYIDMVKNCFREESGFGVCLVKNGAEVGSPSTPYPYGTFARIVDWDQDESGLLLIVARGERKFRIIDTLVDKSELLTGTVEMLPEEATSAVPSELHYLKDALEQILEQVSSSVAYSQCFLDDALWVGSRFVELLPLSAELRHDLLSMDQPQERLSAIAEVFSAIAKHSEKD